MVAGGPGGMPGNAERSKVLLPYLVMTMLAGPSFAGLLMTWLAGGREGLRELGARLLRWRVGLRWWAIALLAAPLTLVATLFLLALVSPDYIPQILTTPDRPALLFLGLAAGLSAGFFEELGWTGFAIPRMRLRFGLATTGLVVGLLWGAWHLLTTWWGSGENVGTVPLAVYLPVLLFSFLPPYRMLMVWVHERTGSVLVAMVMHASLTFSMIILGPSLAPKGPVMTYHLAYAAVLWLVVGAVALAAHGQLASRPLQQRAA